MGNIKHKASELDSIIGSNLKALRMNKSITQESLAQELNVTFQQIQKYEKGDNRMSAATLYKAAHFLNEPMDSFFESDMNICVTNNNNRAFSRDFFELFGLYSKISDKKTKKELITFLKTLVDCFETKDT